MFKIEDGLANISITRSRLRGFQKLKNSNKLGLYRDLKSLLISTKTNIKLFSKRDKLALIPNVNSELICRQYLISYLLDSRFHNALLFSIGSNTDLLYPLPLSWIDALESAGINVQKNRSLYLFYRFLLVRYLKNIARSLKLFFRIPFTSFKYRKIFSRSFNLSYFYQISSLNFPFPNLKRKSYDIFSWYSSWPNRPLKTKALVHNSHTNSIKTSDLPISYLPPPYEMTYSLSGFCKIVLLFFRLLLVSSTNLIRGSYLDSLLLFEVLKASIVNQLPKNYLANDYLFNFSGVCYRPLWTYILENSGASVFLYFYSLCEQPTLPDGVPSSKYVFQPLTWTKYLVWDEQHKNLIMPFITTPNQIDIVGPIPYKDNNLILDLPFKTIAVFDITHFRKSLYFGTSSHAQYHTNPNYLTKFLEDIYSVLSMKNIQMAHKRKRKVSSKLFPKAYLKLIDYLDNKEDYITIDPSVSAFYLALKCRASISSPFTSTGLIAQSLGIPSIYYDPFEWIQKDDPASHGVPIIRGIDALSEWVHNLSL